MTKKIQNQCYKIFDPTLLFFFTCWQFLLTTWNKHLSYICPYFEETFSLGAGKGNGNLLRYPCLGNPMDRGAWWVTVHGVAKKSDRTWWLNNSKLSGNRRPKQQQQQQVDSPLFWKMINAFKDLSTSKIRYSHSQTTRVQQRTI